MNTITHGKYSGYLIVCDIDGTVKPYGEPVPERNLEAIREFTAEGGIFTLATGRSILATSGSDIKEIPVNCPVIVNNGSTMYDYIADKIIYQIPLDASAESVIDGIMQHFPEVGVEVYNGKDLYILRRTDITDMRLQRFDINALQYTYCTASESRKPWHKALAAAEKPTADSIMEYLSTVKNDKILFMRTDDKYCELVPARADKACAVARLAKTLGIEKSHILVAGDHQNDVAMLAAAGVSFAPADATPQARTAADIIGGKCSDGIVREMVDYITSHI